MDVGCESIGLFGGERVDAWGCRQNHQASTAPLDDFNSSTRPLHISSTTMDPTNFPLHEAAREGKGMHLWNRLSATFLTISSSHG